MNTTKGEEEEEKEVEEEGTNQEEEGMKEEGKENMGLNRRGICTVMVTGGHLYRIGLLDKMQLYALLKGNREGEG